MRSLSDVQAEFAAALRDPAVAPPPDVVGPDGGPAPRRFAVYRNNVLGALGTAMAGAFPAVRRMVGEDFFRVMARTYVLEIPPTSPVLLDYGKTFPEFIAGFEPAASLPYLPDVARLERAGAKLITPKRRRRSPPARLPRCRRPSLPTSRSGSIPRSAWSLPASP